MHFKFYTFCVIMKLGDNMEKKKCTICGREKYIDEFVKDYHIKSGYRNQCKLCFNQRKKKREHELNPNMKYYTVSGSVMVKLQELETKLDLILSYVRPTTIDIKLTKQD